MSHDDTLNMLTLPELVWAELASHESSPALVMGEVTLSYGQLREAVVRLAGSLQVAGVKRRHRVVLALPRSIEAVLAELALLELGAVFIPLDLASPPARQRHILQTCRAPWVLSDQAGHDQIPTSVGQRLVVDDLPAGQLMPTTVEADDPAYVVFTSGSTGKPKGAINLHRGLVAMARGVAARLNLGPGDRVSAVSTFAFDISVADVFAPLSCGACLHLVPEDVVTAPALLNQALVTTTSLHATPSRLSLLRARGWRPSPGMRIIAAGEPLETALVNALLADGAQVWNGYGLSECSVFTSVTPCVADQRPTIEDCLDGTELVVVNTHGARAEVGELGELIQRGVGVGSGYIDLPQATAERFIEDPFSPEQIAYRTGDQAFRDADGRLHFRGRADRQVKLRGFRIELGEIEAALSSHPEVLTCAVVCRDKQLIAYAVPKVHRSGWHEALTRFLEELLPAFMIPARFVTLEALPISANGKVDWSQLPAPQGRGDLGEVARGESPLERLVIEGMSEVLSLEEVGATDAFYALGGDSLSALRLALWLEDRTDRRVLSRDVVRNQTPRALAVILEQTPPRDTPAAPSVVSETDLVPLCPTQRQLYFIHALDPEAIEYNVCLRCRIEGPLDVSALHQAYLALLESQPALRTRYRLEGGQPMQTVSTATGGFEVRQFDHLPDDLRESRLRVATDQFFREPFDLHTGPVVRAALFRVADDRAELLFCAHHIAFDGHSIEPWFEGLFTAYSGGSLKPRDFLGAVATHREAGLGPFGGWFQGASPTALPALPRDLNRDLHHDLHRARADAATLSFRIPSTLATQLQRFNRTHQISTFELLATALGLALGQECGQDRVIFGSVVAGREESARHGLIGHFANTLLLELVVNASSSFLDNLARCRPRIREALAHQDAPYDVLVNKLRREGLDDPLRVCLIVHHPIPAPRSVDGVQLRVEEVFNGAVAFNVMIEVWPDAEGYQGQIRYRAAVHDEATIARFSEGLLEALRAAVSEPDRPLPLSIAAIRAENERLLSRDPHIEEALVVSRDGQLQAWVVADQPVQSQLPLTRISHLPRGSSGYIDWSRLERAPVEPERLHIDQVTAAFPKQRRAQDIGATPSASISGEPAVCEGGPLSLAGAPQTLVAVLERAATATGSVSAPGQDTLTHAELQTRAGRMAAGLGALGLRPGDRVLLQVSDTTALLEAFWACVLGGFPVLIMAVPPNYTEDLSAASSVRGIWEALERPALLTTRSLHRALTGFLPAARVIALDEIPDHPETPRSPHPEETLLFLLTSGSTGLPKPVVHTHRSACSFLASYTEALSFGSDDVFLNSLGLDHVAPLFMCHLASVYCCADSMNTPLDEFMTDPARFLDYASMIGATTTFLANFAYGLIADAAQRRSRASWDLSRFRAATNGGEMLDVNTLRRFASILKPYGLPRTASVPIWGMSETCSATLIQQGLDPESCGELVPTGAPVSGFACRVVDEAGAIVSQGQIGRLLVKGPQVTRGYFQRPDANAASFVGDGWFDTGDLARIDQGVVTLSGRLKDLIIINGANYHNHSIEAVAEEVEGVAPSFACAIAARRPGDATDSVALFISPEDEASPDLLRAVRRHVAQRIGISPRWVLPVERGEIPKTAIGKIQRSKIQERFYSGEFDELRHVSDRALGSSELLPHWFFQEVWRRHPGGPPHPRDIAAWVAPGQERTPLVIALGIPLAAPEDQINRLVVVPGLDTAWSVAQVKVASAPEIVVVHLSSGPESHFIGGLWANLEHERGLRVKEVFAEAASPEAVTEELTRGGRGQVRLADGERWVRALRPLAFASPKLPWSGEGLVVVTGGLGGIGRGLIQELERRGVGPVLAIGRRPADEVESPVQYASVDLRDAAALRAALDAEESRSGPAVVFFHLASIMPFHPLGELESSSLYEHRAARFDGTQTLLELARERDAVFVDFGSVNGFFGGFGVTGYVAANRASARLGEQARQREQRVWSLSWSQWSGPGLTADVVGSDPAAQSTARALAKRRGFTTLSPREGLMSLWACLGQPPGAYHIGLDPSKPSVRRHLPDLIPLPLDTPEDESQTEVGGHESPLDNPSLDRVRQIWREALGREDIPVNTNFFDMGGHSMLLLQISVALEEAFGVAVPLPVLFRHPTVSSQASYLDHGSSTAHLDAAKKRAQHQRRHQRRHQRSRQRQNQRGGSRGR